MAQRSRRDSVESHISLWENFPERDRQAYFIAPFADEQSDDASESNQKTSLECEENDTDSDVALPLSPETNNERPWINRTNQQHLRIILNVNRSSKIDEIIREIREDFARQGLRWDEAQEEIRPWYFGLTSIRLDFKTQQSIDIQILSKAARVAPWLKLKTEKQQIVRNKDKTKKPVWEKFVKDCDIKLRYGALTELSRFYYSPQHCWENTPADRDRWTWSLRLDDSKGDKATIQWEIQTFDKKLKKQLLINNINTLAVVHSDVEGFEIYLCQKCNMDEFEATTTTSDPNDRNSKRNSSQNRDRSSSRNRSSGYNRSNSKPRTPQSFPSNNYSNHSPRRFHYGNFRRIGINGGCYFPDIQFSLRASEFGKGRCKSPKHIQATLSLFIEFLLAHNITICYGNIHADEGPKPQLFFQDRIPQFKSRIMTYSWQMLSIVGYRLQNQINDKFRESLHEIGQRDENPDELMYHVCVYLSRIFSIKPFADINEELTYAIQESKRKRSASAYGLIRKFVFKDENEAYIPSITITPTTIRIKPLKLCRTNRVLRATREFGSALKHFALVDIRDENGRDMLSYHFQDLRKLLLDYLNDGFSLMGNNRPYVYLHHSQSQLREKQFWFYHHEQGKNLSTKAAYKWMGTFDQERNPAKYAARIALCFSTTKKACQVEIGRVRFEKDIERTIGDKKYVFTDGCGTMSESLRDQIMKVLRIRRDFSAVQFRYDGSKGVVSLDPTIARNVDLIIRKSMKKFDSTHDTFEVCKLSAPRPLYLNRQAILLLSYRKVPDTSFIILQQQNHLQLIRALLRNIDAEQLILQKVPSWFLPRNIHRTNIDYIHEPFFRQLLIAACVQSTRELLHRTRIRVPQNEGRNLMGVVDEYDVLKPDEVFIQYTVLTERAADDGFSYEDERVNILNGCQVVITKNPCHHPGDIRTFTAVDKPELRHLKDVVVFSQRGDRPAPHDISGSDLDGDEYLVVWHKDLVPLRTKNAEPYDYDSGVQLKDCDGPMEREIINDTVLDIAENNYLGQLSNLHLAFADKFGVDDNKDRGEDVYSTVELAGAISLEVDSGKTGYHPVDDKKMKKLKNVLNSQRPDFMDKPDFEQYESKHILGQLYRLSKQTVRRWNKLVRYHRHLRHLEVRIKADIDETEEELDSNTDGESTIQIDESLFTGFDKTRHQYKECKLIAEKLDFVYRQEILEILNLYGLSHESDLWCRNSVNGLSGELEDTAYTELEQLVNRTRDSFYLNLVPYCEDGKCDCDTPIDNLCTTCKYGQIYTALACYEACYTYAGTSQQAPILSLPWIFTTQLLYSRVDRNTTPPPNSLLGEQMKKNIGFIIEKKRSLYLNDFSLTFQTTSKTASELVEIPAIACAFIEILLRCTKLNKYNNALSLLDQFVKDISLHPPSGKWQFSGKPHKITSDDNTYVALLLSISWSADDDKQIHDYFDKILNICFQEGRTREDTDVLNVSEDIILLLQRMAIKETIQEN